MIRISSTRSLGRPLRMIPDHSEWQTIWNATRPFSRPFGIVPYLSADHSECYQTSRQTIQNATRPPRQTIWNGPPQQTIRNAPDLSVDHPECNQITQSATRSLGRSLQITWQTIWNATRPAQESKSLSLTSKL